MKWFDQWFYSKVRWACMRADYEHPDWKKREDLLDELYEKDEPLTVKEYSVSSRDQVLDENPHALYDGLRIDVKRLNGGYIVTFRHPADNKSQYVEEVKRNSYIVNEDEDFNTKLVKLLTMELLK